MDIQGAELEVIRGANRAIGESTFAVVTEIGFRQVYREQPLFRDIDRALTDLGFVLLSIDNAQYPVSIRRRGVLGSKVGDRGEWLWADGTYVRDLVSHPELVAVADPAASLRILLVLESLWFIGYALAAAEIFANQEVESAELVRALAAAIAKRHEIRWYERHSHSNPLRERMLRRLLGRAPYG